jgi:hypothetical protein
MLLANSSPWIASPYDISFHFGVTDCPALDRPTNEKKFYAAMLIDAHWRYLMKGAWPLSSQAIHGALDPHLSRIHLRMRTMTLVIVRMMLYRIDHDGYADACK